MISSLRAAARLVYFAVYTLVRIAQILIGSLFVRDKIQFALRVRRSWARHLLPAIGVRLRVEGAPPDFPCLVLGNHRSYLDPIIIICDVLGWPVSKAEVASWPIVGAGARLSGVLFLKRESLKSRKHTLRGIAEKVAEGWPVILFPEGTTTDLPATAPFRRGSFQLAAQNAVPIVPVAISYSDPRDYWIGDATFLPHFFQCFGKKNVDVWLAYGPTIAGNDAEDLQTRTKEWIDNQLLGAGC